MTERKIDDSKLENVSGAVGEEIRHLADDPPANDPQTGIDLPDDGGDDKD